MLVKVENLANEPGQLVAVTWYRSLRTPDLRLLRVPVTVFGCSSASVEPGETYSKVVWRFFKGSRSRNAENAPESEWFVGSVEVNAGTSDPMPSIVELLDCEPSAVEFQKWVHKEADVVTEKVICDIFEGNDEWVANAMHLDIEVTDADKDEAIRKLKLAVREALVQQGRTAEASLSDDELFEWLD